MADTIKSTPETFVDDVEKVLMAYSTEATEDVKAAAKEAIELCDQTIKQNISFKQHTGKYVDAFATEKTEETQTTAEWVWHVAAPQYRLAHLLEKGHGVYNGKNGYVGETKAYPHIKFGAKAAKKFYEEAVEEALKG